MPSMLCPSCGKAILEGVQFCGFCGKYLSLICPICRFENPPDFRYCGKCGNLLVNIEQHLPFGLESSPLSSDNLPATQVEHKDRSSQIIEPQRKIITVLLADVYNSTIIFERLGSEDWLEIINRILKIMEDEILRFGGKIDQFRGDGLVAFFGVDIAHDDDPECAVMAGLLIQKRFNEQITDITHHKLDLKIRIGINTGEVVVTSLGESSEHQEDTAMGEAVAIAARMETSAQPGTILISENTYRIVANKFLWESLGTILVKGISQPIAVFRPLEIIL
jgi:class 3 adenylate cyclase